MSSEFIKVLNQNNICTWYILPLVGLNKFNFNEANFLDSYITRDGRYIAVAVIDWNLCANVTANKHYAKRIVCTEDELLIFSIPRGWENDIKFFMKGEYSHMSEFAKQMIRENSGLTYDELDEDGNRRTDAFLMALDKHPVLRKKWMDELGIEIEPGSELLSVPSEKCYIDLLE